MVSSDKNLTDWHTHAEIYAQPKIWREWADELENVADDIRKWIELRQPKEIWFCGAGTSAFIGETLSAHLGVDTTRIYRSIPTTDFVSVAYNYPQPKHRVLVVSFGRSGESSETIAMLDMLNQHYADFDRLNITCNRDSHLANCPLPQISGAKCAQKTIILPDETLDKGFAMTSSYTTMLMTALACFDSVSLPQVKRIMAELSAAAETLLARLPTQLAKYTNPQGKNMPNRCIFLGSGALLGTARESALKILELAAGQIITQWDSCLGFRHGPKAVVNQDSHVFVFISNHAYTRQYDLDIAEEIAAQYGAENVTTIGLGPEVQISLATGLSAQLAVNDGWCSLLYVLVSHILCIQFSQALGLNVDNPFDAGNLTRVVAGVKIYPYAK
ncbi:MAG: SIS domain-containing protein [Rhizobiales bacterium]|nr:SIS domain-containing protein [Hyphomicrobiales bacterium]NRB13488.1 SIS domain-containing protein [Hyphomicrobiales bacterium]